MATFLELKEGILRKLAWKDDKVGLLPVPLTSTTTAADKAGIRDTALARGTHGAGNYDGRHVEIVETVAGSPTLGSVAAVDVGGFDLTDLIAVSPDFDDEVQSGTDYLMYPKNLVPETVADAINGVLKKTEAPYLWAPSLVTDSDMEADDLLKWLAVGTPATRAFVTTAAHILHGPRSLHLVSRGVTRNGAMSGGITTHEGEPFLASVLAKSVLGDFDVALYDAANGADIKSVNVAVAVTGGWVEVRIQGVMPTATVATRVFLRFTTTTAASATLYVTPPVIVQSAWRRAYDAPSWLVSESQVLEVVHLSGAHLAEIENTRVALSSQMRTALGLDFQRSDRDATPMRVSFANPSGNPVYLLCKRPFAKLSALTDETPCDEEFVVAKAAAQILKNRGDEGWWLLDREAEKRALKMGYGGRELRSESPTVLV